MSGQQLKALCEVLINIRYGHLPLNDDIKKKWHKKKDIIRQLTGKKITQKQRKVVIGKEANLLTSTLKVVLPLLKKKNNNNNKV